MHLACLQVKENTCMQPQTFTVLPQSCANTCAAHGQLLPLAALFKATWVSQNQDLKFCKNTCTGMKREILGPTEELHVLRLPQAENRPYLSSVNICLSHVSAISQASQLGPSFFFLFFFSASILRQKLKGSGNVTVASHCPPCTPTFSLK